LGRAHQPTQVAAALGDLVLLPHLETSFLFIPLTLHELDHMLIHKVLQSTAWIRQK